MTLRPTASHLVKAVERGNPVLFLRTPDEDGACAGVVRRRRQLPQGEPVVSASRELSSLYQVCSGSIKPSATHWTAVSL